MNLENVLAIMDRFDHSEAVTLELQMEDASLKLKKADGIAAKAVPVSQMPMSTAQMGAPVTAPVIFPGQGEVEQESAVQGQPQNVETVSADYIKAPLVGVFYASPSPEKAPFVSVGTKVNKGDTVCLIEAMKMMSEVTASKSGMIEEIMVENGSLVEFDMPLFRIQ